MKPWGYFGCCVIAFFLFSTGAPAETKFIKTIVRITLRTGPGLDHKIISMIKSGQKVEVLETERQWSKIQTEQGQIGWIMTSLISAIKPSQFVPATPAAADKALLEQQASSQEEISTLKAENERLGSQLAESRGAWEALNESFQAFKNESGEFLKLKSDLGKTTAALKEQKEKVAPLEEQITEFQMQQTIWWFLSGAGVLILGFIIGYSTKRQRRRSLLL